MTRDALVARGCTGKTVYSPGGARHAAARLRTNGERVSPYRCPWCTRWHVGHVPSMASVEQIARAIRGLD